MRCKRTYVNTLLPLAGGLIKQTTAASDWSVRLRRTDRSQGGNNDPLDPISGEKLTYFYLYLETIEEGEQRLEKPSHPVDQKE